MKERTMKHTLRSTEQNEKNPQTKTNQNKQATTTTKKKPNTHKNFHVGNDFTVSEQRNGVLNNKAEHLHA